jgi:hypothetical protein
MGGFLQGLLKKGPDGGNLQYPQLRSGTTPQNSLPSIIPSFWRDCFGVSSGTIILYQGRLWLYLLLRMYFGDLVLRLGNRDTPGSVLVILSSHLAD